MRQATPKGETLTDWRRRPLSQDQIRYAFDDVRDLLALWKRIDGRLTRLGRSSWAKRSSPASSAGLCMESGEVERWRKLKGVSNLDGRRLAVVREVYRWREEAAAKRNRPARTVLRDDLLVEIAKRTPKSERRDLQPARRRPGRPGRLDGGDRAARSARPEDNGPTRSSATTTRTPSPWWRACSTWSWPTGAPGRS